MNVIEDDENAYDHTVVAFGIYTLLLPRKSVKADVADIKGLILMSS